MRILLVVDKKGRVQYNRAEIIKKYIPEHDIDLYFTNGYTPKDIYDIVYYSHFSLFNKLKLRGKKGTYCSITSHKCCENIEETVKIIKEFDRVSVNNNILFNIFSKYIDNLYYTPNGVDTKTFSFCEKNITDNPVIGWVGNRDRSVKNYNEIVCPLVTAVPGVNFLIISTSKKDEMDDLKNQIEMVNFYHSLHYFIVTSSAEGTPNTALEAMSCGVPVISTYVGNMVDIIKDGENGFLIDDTLEAFIEKLNSVKYLDRYIYIALRHYARKNIEQWDWDIKIDNWKKFLIY